MTNQETKFTLANGLGLRRATADERQECQAGLLKSHLLQAAKTRFYQRLFKDNGIDPAMITMADFHRVPLTNRRDVEAFPEDFFAVPPVDQVDLALTSGSTGNPVLVPYSARDLERLAFNEQMAFRGVGIRQDDTVLLSVTIDRCFIAGLAYYSGLVRLGAAVIRSGPGQPARQWEIINRLKPTAIVGVPSFLLRIAQWGKEHGFDPAGGAIKRLITIGEPIRGPELTPTPLGARLAEVWQAEIFSSYGATELETAFCECPAAGGGHVHPELMIVEIVDDNGRKVSDGEPGEVVVTPLGVEGFPLVRFRTGDIARLHTETCPCGWQTPRLGPIEGRLKQRLKCKGTTIYPEMIFQAAQEIRSVKAVYIEVRSAFDLSDEVKVVVGTDDRELTCKKLGDLLQARLRVRPEIEIRDHREVIADMEKAGGRKLKNLFDFRKGLGQNNSPNHKGI